MKDNGTTALNTTPKTETQPGPGGVICILGNIDVKHNNTTPKTETQPDPGGVICILGNIDVKHN